MSRSELWKEVMTRQLRLWRQHSRQPGAARRASPESPRSKFLLPNRAGSAASAVLALDQLRRGAASHRRHALYREPVLILRARGAAPDSAAAAP